MVCYKVTAQYLAHKKDVCTNIEGMAQEQSD